MDIQEILEIRKRVVQKLLKCTVTNPVQAVSCGPDDPCSEDAEWILHIYTPDDLEEKALDVLKRTLESFDAPFNIIPGERFSLLPPATKRAGLPGGVGPESAISHDQSGDYGTLGMIVKRNGTDRYLLTCSHVAPNGSDVYSADGTLIATNAEAIDLDASSVVADAAIAKLKDGVNFSASFPPAMQPVTDTPQSPAVGMKVKQAGAASVSPPRFGCIAQWPCDACIYISPTKSRHFTNVAVVKDPTFAQHGDSGSIVVDQSTGNPVGIAFACRSIHANACQGPVLIASLPEALGYFHATPVVR